MNAETNIRNAAAALLAAVQSGRAAGLSVQWPSRVDGLASIAISATAKATPIAAMPVAEVVAEAAYVPAGEIVAGEDPLPPGRFKPPKSF